MKNKQFIITLALVCFGLSVKAQINDVPNNMLAAKIQMLKEKIGMPPDSAEQYLQGFTKHIVDNAKVAYKSDLEDVTIIFQKDDNNNLQMIVCSMPVSFLSTAKKAISLMGMIASGTAAPPGYVAYATPKYAAFLNPGSTTSALSLVILQGGK